MKEALAKLEKEVQELHKEEQTKLEEEKKKALDRLQRLVRTCFMFPFDNSLVNYSKTCLRRPLKNRQNKDLSDK